MNKNKSGKVSLGTVICIFIIFLLCVGLALFYLKYNDLKSQIAQFEQDAINKDATINDLQTKIDKIAETINETKTNVDSNNEKVSVEDTIKELFLAKMKEINKTSSEELLDYRVDKVEIIPDSEKQTLVESRNYKSTDVLADVTYSVKPKDVSTTNWTAGNGEISGEWVINKTACECLRDGKLINTTGFATSF